MNSNLIPGQTALLARGKSAKGMDNLLAESFEEDMIQ